MKKTHTHPKHTTTLEANQKMEQNDQ